jgi:hypothetical protein
MDLAQIIVRTDAEFLNGLFLASNRYGDVGAILLHANPHLDWRGAGKVTGLRIQSPDTGKGWRLLWQSLGMPTVRKYMASF